MDFWTSYRLECTYIPPEEQEEKEDINEDEFTEYDDYLFDKYRDEKYIEELEEQESDGGEDIQLPS